MKKVFINELLPGDVVDWALRPAKVLAVYPPLPSATLPGKTVVWFDLKTQDGRVLHLCGASFKEQIYRIKEAS